MNLEFKNEINQLEKGFRSMILNYVNDKSKEGKCETVLKIRLNEEFYNLFEKEIQVQIFLENLENDNENVKYEFLKHCKSIQITKEEKSKDRVPIKFSLCFQNIRI